MSRPVRRLWAMFCLVGSAACGHPPETVRRAAAEEVASEHRPVRIDSAVPREVALRRFQQASRRVATLAGGERTREALVRAYVRALERRDTTALARLLLTRDEFAFLYYPTNPRGLPPYDLAPELMWFMLSQGSERGLGRALQERGGRPLGYLSHQCDGMPSREGENLVWGPCQVRRRLPDGGRGSERLFGLILERGGRYKFVSYANKL
ncbi:MAG: hypothetical protein ACJ8DC_18995 [Gemmatimonadales bacterium]